MTRYLVFSKAEGSDAWAQVGPDFVEASSEAAAIRSVAAERGAGEYVAVPARSFKPRTVTVQQTTKVSFGSDT